ncbi:MAG TPA: 1,4-alpha-glucan branching protein GlgB [Stellaceae bacterium]|nr:1,4-alpha-glucan branching protein GlgB [Stellaceae bacterium]
MMKDADERAIAALVAGDHGDPFSFLGMHPADAKGAVAVRTFQPKARGVVVIDARSGEVAARLARVHEAGMFAGTVRAGGPFPYRLRLETDEGARDLEDPYGFPPVLSDYDLHLIVEGTHRDIYEKLGAHVAAMDGVAGVAFTVWAPNARRVSVVGPFNDWDGRCHPMRHRHDGGIWELFVPGLGPGALYKYEIKAESGGLLALKADPYAFSAEHPPATASIVHDLGGLRWSDRDWLARRDAAGARDAPVSIYEVHLGSWRRRGGAEQRYLSYRELADELVPYVRDLGFTHIELLPVAEYPFDGSWGYQPIGLYAPTSRYGAPDDFAAFVGRCHGEGLGVIIDWVAGHFPSDAHGLACFDGTYLYEHADPRLGRHADWGTLIYNYGRREVANYLVGNALFWIDRYHIDGLRVDAVASMLYLDYSRGAGEWVPNRYGGRENLEAIDFLRRVNEAVYGRGDGAVTLAEESTAWPMVSRPTYLGGLGFGYKWNMGWMHDTLAYMTRDPIHRKFHHDRLTFGLLYAFTENFILPLSHDEVVHGKGSLLGKMPGDRWQKFANLRAYYGFMYTMPGKKLLFMGGEFAQEREWNHDTGLDWELLADPMHRGVSRLIRDLNGLYRGVAALHERDCVVDGFEWIDCSDAEQSVISYIRRAADATRFAVIVCNFTPVVRQRYRIGVPRQGFYRERINTDAQDYGGSGVGNLGGVAAEEIACHGRPWSLTLTLPPLATLVLTPEGAS